MPSLIRVGEKLINLRNVIMIDLDWQDEEGGEPEVVIEFLMRGMDELDEGQNLDQPYLKFLSAAEAEAIRRFLKKKCPDLLAEQEGQ